MHKHHLSAVSSELPDPPYPAEIKANGWKPELDVDRIVQSDTWTLAEDDERPWLLRIWLESWRSVPVGSMPSDRGIFARRIGCTRPFLDAHAEILLRGWRLHSDERLYHDYITGQVERMLETRRNANERQRRSRQNKKANKINETSEMSRVTHSDSRVSHAQEQEQEQEREEDNCERTLSVAPAKPPRKTRKRKSFPDCPYAEIARLWAEILPERAQPLPDPQAWSEANRAQIRARWRDQLPTLDHWRRTFEYIRESPFLMGKTHAPDRRPFRITLWWITKPKHLQSLYEGTYDD